MPTLILLRHGQSTYNLENRFTGELDIDLTKLGEQEAMQAAIFLNSYHIDIAFTSVLKRAVHTLSILLNELGKNIPVIKSKALNERNYGDLQGCNKQDTSDKYGTAQVALWRRSFNTAPPHGESLKDTCNRVIPYYQKTIEPELKRDQNVLIVAHGNSLRALMMHLDGYSEDEIADINIATGIPRVYEFSAALKLESAGYLEG